MGSFSLGRRRRRITDLGHLQFQVLGQLRLQVVAAQRGAHEITGQLNVVVHTVQGDAAVHETVEQILEAVHDLELPVVLEPLIHGVGQILVRSDQVDHGCSVRGEDEGRDFPARRRLGIRQ